MLERIKRPLTFRRILFLVMGGFVCVSSLKQMEWVGVFIGAYFFSMGLFTLGCADNCGIPLQRFSTNNEVNTEEIEYEEVK